VEDEGSYCENAADLFAHPKCNESSPRFTGFRFGSSYIIYTAIESINPFKYITLGE
jgi:hypothetical protein